MQSGMLLATMLASAPKPTAAEGRPIAQGENGESFDSLLSLFLGDRPLVAHDGEGSPMEASAPDMEGEQGPLLEGPEYTLPEETRQEELGPNPEQEVHPERVRGQGVKTTAHNLYPGNSIPRRPCSRHPCPRGCSGSYAEKCTDKRCRTRNACRKAMHWSMPLGSLYPTTTWPNTSGR